MRPADGTPDHSPVGPISEDIEKCGDTIYLFYDRRVAANRRINDRTLLGKDRMLKANTVKTCAHALFRQGCHYYAAIPAMKQELLEPPVLRFGEYVPGQLVYVHAFGLK